MLGYPEAGCEKEILGTTTYEREGKKAESGEKGEKKVDPQCSFKEGLSILNGDC